ncbi:MAG: exodeoxyribonuclease VII large subunit [Oscillospiraceae bacterium]|nr:exodeoxyribonuclease VII large subunit [Oscillospiraceae bacterium]
MTRQESRAAGQVWTVTDLQEYIAGKLRGDSALQRIVVRGEISGFKRQPNGHCYFQLKDAGAVLRAAMFANFSKNLKFEPENGMTVLAAGSIDLYAPQGQHQLKITSMYPDGIGAQHLALQQRIRKLESEGIFDPAHKKPLPQMPRNIGIVTSPTAAALADVKKILGKRCPMAVLHVIPALVQGTQAPHSIARGIAYADTLGLDLMIVGRGGGSKEDLDCFNAEEVAYALYRCQTPVISAVGHNIDHPISDDAADAFAATPSEAVEMAVPDLPQLYAQIDAAKRELDNAFLAGIRTRQIAAQKLYTRLGERRPDARIRLMQAECTRLRERMDAVMLRQLDARQQAAQKQHDKLGQAILHSMQEKAQSYRSLQDKLSGLDPMRVLLRGYAAVLDPDGQVVSSAAAVQPGDALSIRMADGTLDVKVERKHEL